MDERRSWTTCHSAVFFRVYMKNDKSNNSGRPLTVDVSWTTATGLSGQEFRGSPVINVENSQSRILTVFIPDDGISHGCNKLIVHVRSLMPGVYRTMPYTRSQGFEYVTYIDNDGGNPDAPAEDDGRVSYYKTKFTRYCSN